MPTLFLKASKLDFDDWVRGILSAGISGFFSVLSGAIVLPSLDANGFNIFKLRYYIALFALGLTSAVVSISKFLATRPLPDVKQVTATTQMITPPATPGGPVVIETLQEKHMEPMPTQDKSQNGKQ